MYVDGFNLYYGILKNTAYKWLDLERFFTLLRPHDEIEAIKYCTALVDAGAQRARQATYLNALATRPLVETILGRFKQKQVICSCSGCTQTAPGTRTFVVPEEKRTDVNIAIRMLDDAYRGLCERQVLVSGDSDLVPAIQMVRQRFPEIRTTVYVRQERWTEALLSNSEQPPTVTEHSRWCCCRGRSCRRVFRQPLVDSSRSRLTGEPVVTTDRGS